MQRKMPWVKHIKSLSATARQDNITRGTYKSAIGLTVFVMTFLALQRLIVHYRIHDRIIVHSQQNAEYKKYTIIHPIGASKCKTRNS